MLKSNIPAGSIDKKWEDYKGHVKLVNPANKRSLEVIIIGTGLAGASAAASLGEMGYKVKAFCFQDSPRRAHSIAAQGGINAAKKSVLADRNANVLNEAYGKEVSARTGANDVILVGPAGASAGRAVAAQHLAAAQGALQHTDEEESRAVNAANLKALDKTWVSGSQEQHVGIANGALVGEISS